MLLGQDPADLAHDAPAALPAETLRRCTREQLLDAARRLGLTGVSKLPKEALAGRVQFAFEGLAGGRAAHNGSQNGDTAQNGDAAGAGPAFHKFDLGPTRAGDADPEAEAVPQNIPWGYGHDRVTAMYVNPERLYVYWETTDAAIEVARRALGPAGAGAWLSLRVYDITGRLFDGTNAHSYFDHQIERHDRQWFFDIGKPTSTTCVEIGLKSGEGYFVKIARSGRIDFPRRGPAGDGPVEWLTVRNASGAPGELTASQAGGPGGDAGGTGAGQGGPGAGAAGAGGDQAWAGWTEGAGFPEPGGHRVFERRWEWQEGAHDNWTSELARVEWVGPLERAEWESGPFTYEVPAPPLVEQRDTGEVSVKTHGNLVHLVYGPWRVVIRGIGARAERRVLGTWEYRRTVAVSAGTERTAAVGGGTWTRVGPGSSDWMLMGSSERHWMGASELLYRGSSELYLIGASELRMMGASETLFLGGSEYRFRGATERLMRGASEYMYRGASERLYAGASERLYAGASERLGEGASERRLGGASEAFPSLPVASEIAGGLAAAPAEPPPIALPAPDPLPYPKTN